MYKPRHKKPMELKPNGKVVGLAASAVMLATPVLQTVGAVSAETTPDPNPTDMTNGNTSDSIVQTAAEEADSDTTETGAPSGEETTYTYEQLTDLINTVTTEIGSDKTNGFVLPSLVDLNKALAIANDAKLTEASTTDEVTPVYEALQTANNTYKTGNQANTKADLDAYTALSNAINETQNKINTEGDSYTSDSVANAKGLIAAVTADGGILTNKWTTDDSAAFQTQAKDTTANISEALVAEDTTPETPTVDKTALKDAIDKANSLGDATQYTTTTYKNVQTALTEAQTTYDDETATSEQVATATSALTEALAKLADAADKSVLKSTTTAAEKIDVTGYTETTGEALTAMIKQAQTVIDNGDAKVDDVTKAITDLNTAIAKLEKAPETVDTSALKTIVDVAGQLKLENYTEPTGNALTTALDDAKKIIDGKSEEPVTAETVTGAITALNEAIAGLEAAQTTVNTDALQTLIDKTEAINRDNYTTDSLQALDDAVEKGNQAIATPTADGVIQALAGLSTAMIGLEAKPDTTTLNAITTIAENLLNTGDYTSDTRGALDKAIKNAQAVIKDPEATADGVKTALTTLNTAIKGLELNPEKVDTTALQSVVTLARSLKASDYTSESYMPFTVSLNKANAILKGDVTATAENVSDALTDLNTKIGELVAAPETPTTVDKAALNSVIAAAIKLDANDFTDKTFAPFKSALTEAQATSGDKDATAEEVTTALNKLNAAIGNLQAATVAVDKTALQSMVDKSNTVNGANYTTDSYQALGDATTAAQKVLDNDDATTEDVTGALTALNTAYAGLVTTNVAQAKADLQAALTLAENYLSVNYTTDSYGALKAAVNSGQIVYEDDSVTNVNDVTDATNAIKAAIKGLVPLKYGATVQNIKDLQAKVNDLRVWDYTQDSWNALVDANEYATNVLNLGADATKEQLDTAYAYLNNAFSNLKAVSETNILKQLGDLSTQVQNLNQGQFTDTSWAKLATAQAAAQAILTNDNGYNASVASVQNAYDNLQAAVKGLVSVYGDSNQQTDLTNLYKKVQYYTKGSVADDAWQAFLVARDNAATALKSDDSTVIDYMNAYDALAKTTKALGNDADMSYIASAAYTDIDGVGKVFFEGQGIVLYDKPNGQQVDDADGEGRLLADQSEWKVMRQATLQDGSSWYEVGKNEWVNARYVMIENAQIGQIDYLPDMAVNLWNFQPDGIHFTGQRLDNGTAWEMWGSMMINGEQYFNLGANQWVNAQYITVMA